MKNTCESPSRRNFLGTIVKGAAALTIGGAVQEGVKETLSKSPENPPEQESPYYTKRIKEALNEQHRRHFETVQNGNAHEPYILGSKTSRLEYVIQTAKDSPLPPYFKKILPFIPFQESSYSLTAESGSGAVGVFQFTPETAEEYRLEDPTDITQATPAAISYLQEKLRILKSNSDYQTLQLGYGLDDEELLYPATLLSYNAGIEHIKRAFAIMARNRNEKTTVDRYRQSGKFGIFCYITDEYRKRYQELQAGLSSNHRGTVLSSDIQNYDEYGKLFSSGNFLGKHGEHYVYKIEAFAKRYGIDIHENTHELSDGIFTGISAMSMLALLRLKDVILSRRELLQTLLRGGPAIGIAGLGGYLNRKTNFVPEMASIAKNISRWTESAIDNADAAEETQDVFPKNVVETVRKRAITIARPDDKSTIESIGLEIRKKNYPYQQYMGDAAHQLLNEVGDPIYRDIAVYFYKNALSLAEGQQNGTYPPPPEEKGGRAKIAQRIFYCKRALSGITRE